MKTTYPALAAMFVLISGCGEPSPLETACGHGGIRLMLRDADGAAVTVFDATVDLGTATWNNIACVGDGLGPNGVGCPGPVAFPDTPEGSIFTIRAPGFANAVAAADYSSPADEDACHPMTVTLKRLEPFEMTTDYTTGFAAGDGLTAFKGLASTVTSPTGTLSAVKFYIDDIAGSPVVYFQNTKKHPLHFNFARNVLGKSLTLDEYEETTYRGLDRTAMAGTLVHYDGYSASLDRETQIDSPVSIEFFPSDDLTPAQALLAHDLILERMQFLNPFGLSSRLAYVPATTAHQDQLDGSGSIFERTGALWLSREGLLANITVQLMNRGTAYGRLLRLTPDELATTVVSWKDIVLLTRLPIEAPLVGGFITEELQTPLSHVNVAAMSRHTPNMALVDASEDPRIKPFIYPGTGGDGSGIVRFEVTRDGFALAWATLAEAEEFWGQMRPTDLVVPEADVTTQGLLDFADLGFADSKLVGAKAANLAESRKVLGDTVPDGFAVPFHYYQSFIETSVVTAQACRDARDDCIDEGRDATLCIDVCTLCETGDGLTLASWIAVLLADPVFVSDATFREASLDGLRHLFGHIPIDPVFAQELESKIDDRFETTAVRMRSSTNAEDLAEFSGAGLYESLTVNTADKIPSERIRKVWASVWNWRAFEERSFMGLNHLDVKMGVAVNRSFPAEIANGVLITRNLQDPAVDAYYVNVQAGETSVTNPPDGSLPEVFSMSAVGSGLKIFRTRYSSLSNDAPLMTDEEMTTLYLAARRLHDHFATLYRANPMTFALDIEFKLDSPDRKLIIKQARPYPWSP